MAHSGHRRLASVLEVFLQHVSIQYLSADCHIQSIKGLLLVWDPIGMLPSLYCSYRIKISSQPPECLRFAGELLSPSVSDSRIELCLKKDLCWHICWLFEWSAQGCTPGLDILCREDVFGGSKTRIESA